MEILTIEEFNNKYYIDYQQDFENALTMEDGKVQVGEGNHIGFSNFTVSDVNTGKTYYHVKYFDSLLEEVEKFCKENKIKLVTGSRDVTYADLPKIINI